MKDLLRSGELPERPLIGHRTCDRLIARRWRRPAGNTARTWSKFDTDDPFEPRRRRQQPTRAVYAAGRFRQIDAAKKKKSGGSAATEHEKRIAALKAMQERQRNDAMRKAQQGQASKPTSESSSPPKPSSKPPRPERQPTSGDKPQGDQQRGLPRPSPPPSRRGRVSHTGRIRARPTASRSRPAGPSPEELERRRPPKVKPPEPTHRAKKRSSPTSKGKVLPPEMRRPPVVSSGRDERLPGAEPEPEPEPPEADVEAEPTPADDESTDKPRNEAGPRRMPKPASSMGLDDLFSTPMEGRVRIGRSDKDDKGEGEDEGEDSD